MELRQLRHFVTVARHGNFRRAASEACITQQALSASIAKLEDSLGAPLFERGPHGVELSPLGERLLDRARLICSEAFGFEQEAREVLDAQTGSVRIGAGALFTERLLANTIAKYTSAHPRVDITITEGISQQLFNLLGRGELDFTLSTPVAGLEPPPDLQHVVLFSMPTEVVMSKDHPLLEEGTPSFESLAQWPWIVAAAYDGQRQQLLSAFEERGVAPPDHLMRTDAIPVLRSLILEHNYLMLSARAPGEMSVLPIDEICYFDYPEFHGLTQAVLAWRRSGSMLPAARKLMEYVKDAYATTST